MRAEGKSERVTVAVLFAVGAAALLLLCLVAIGGFSFPAEIIALTTLVGAVLICVSAPMAARSRGVTTSK